MTAIEIIEDTVAYYSEDTNRRATNIVNGMCEYLTKDGRMCAVGRCLLPSKNKGLNHGFLNLRTASEKRIEKKDNYFKAKYRGFPEDFWNDLQYLHDREFHWGRNELTEEGKKYVKILKKNMRMLKTD